MQKNVTEKYFQKKAFKARLHWRDLYAKTHDVAFITCLGHLGRRDTDRIVSIYVATQLINSSLVSCEEDKVM
jgi:hypothetical protein